MSASLSDDLRQDIAAGRVLVVAGAGVGIAATHRAASASWVGLIEAGMSRALEVNASLPNGWEASVRNDLQLGQEGLATCLWSAADKVTDALGGRDGGEFKLWLRNEVGGLQVKDARLIEALHGWRVPIATTNYDSLLEEVTGRRPVTWLDVSAVQTAVTGRSDAIAHLHGHWETPASVVFGGLSYGTVTASEPAQALQKAVIGTKSLVFVGCGEGLNDPNWLALRTWTKQVMGQTELRHYRLCRADELETVSAEHQDERILPLVYGDGHDDLAPFIESLRPADSPAQVLAAPIRASASERAFDALCERARGRIVLGDKMLDVETRGLERLLVPPVLLPMTQEQFYNSQDLDREARPKRCDPVEDVKKERVVLVVAQEGSGLTSALEWLVALAYQKNTIIAPVLVDFTSIVSGGHDPLKRRITKELMAAGAIHLPRDSHPPIALALDNIGVKPERLFARVLEELAADLPNFLVLGCRQGTEAEITQRLESAGIDFALRYVGRMTTQDVVRLAGLVEPARAVMLAHRAVEVADREHLARTPMTLALLISVLLHGESLLGTASETALLDAYVSLLLGRGDPHDDARFSLDAVERADILGTLAEHFATANTGALPQADVIAIFSDYFEALGWEESAIAVLNSFSDRRLLTVRNNHVSFTQSSFLHLFAAKRAVRSREFLQSLLERPLYFSSIIKHYAALTRDDPTVLREVESLLDQALTTETVGTHFSELASPPEIESVDDDVVARRQAAPMPSVTDDAEDIEEWIQSLDIGDPSPFPVHAIEDAPFSIQVMEALALVSNVLRDSELVDDLELKQRVLHKALIVWGKLADILEADETYQEFLARLGERIAESLPLSKGKREEFVEDFCDLGPIMTSAGGIAATLASRKLARLLDRLFEESDFVEGAEAAIMGAMLGVQLRVPQWPRYFTTVRELHGPKKVVNVVLRRFAISAYYSPATRDDEAAGIETFLIDQYLAQKPALAGRALKERRDSLAQSLRANRALAAARRKEEIAHRKALDSAESEGAGGLGKVIDGEVVD